VLDTKKAAFMPLIRFYLVFNCQSPDNQGYKAITLAAKHGLDKVMIYFLKTGAGG